MHYIEWVLTQGAALWRAREETMKKRLTRSAAPSQPEAAAKADGNAEAPEAAAPPGPAGKLKSGAEMAADMDAQGLRSEEPEEAGDAVRAPAVGMTAARAALPQAEQTAQSAAEWMRRALADGGTAGAAAAAAQERTAAAAPQEREEQGTERFSQSLERDARRYDGGFLFY